MTDEIEREFVARGFRKFSAIERERLDSLWRQHLRNKAYVCALEALASHLPQTEQS